VWHSGLTVGQSEVLESMQKRAMRIIFPDLDYNGSLFIAGVDTLEDRREELTRRFFKRNVLPELSCLHGLLPGKRPPDSGGYLPTATAKNYEHYITQTEKFKKSFIPYCVNNFM